MKCAAGIGYTKEFSNLLLNISTSVQAITTAAPKISVRIKFKE